MPGEGDDGAAAADVHAQRTDATVGLDRDGAVGAALVRASVAAEYDGRHGRWRERALELRSSLRWLRSARWPPAHEAKPEAVSLSRSLGWRCRRLHIPSLMTGEAL